MFKILSISWIILIAIGHALPGSDMPNTFFLNIPHFDKLVHTVFFMIAYYLVATAYSKQYSTIFSRYLIVGLITYGLLLEFLQGSLFVDRSMDVFDFIADSLGVFIGLFLIKKIPFYPATHSNKKV